MQTNDKWKPFSWYCPNCGVLSTGYEDASETVKAECRRCHAVVVRRCMGRRHNRIDIYAPKGEDGSMEEHTAFQ